jgi:membrane-bound metal-dependent hydrolase YbcI (DUF457 family)
MDPLTHGITGALIAKAFFTDRYARDAGGEDKARVATWAMTLGAILPDIDIFIGPITHNDLAVIEVHRSVTHSILCLPIWAVLLAALMRWYARARGKESPSWGLLAAICAVGLASHILLDVVTSFGTMVWSPWKYTRAAWDLVFIIDIALTGIVLLPQLLAWAYGDRERSFVRALRLWAFSTAGMMLFALLARAVGFPLMRWALPVALVVLVALWFGPMIAGSGFRVPRAGWCRAGVYALGLYLLLCTAAHHAALGRVKAFAAARGVPAEQVAALPLPPSAAGWDGLIRTPDGVWEARINLLSRAQPEFHFYMDAQANGYLDAARQLPRVHKYLWFARFPVYRFRERDGHAVVEISDLRFFGRSTRLQPFTFRVEFDAAGRVVEQGWAGGRP